MRWVLILALGAVPIAAHGQSDSATTFANAINQCRAIHSDADRLHCFDRVASGDLAQSNPIQAPHGPSTDSQSAQSEDDPYSAAEHKAAREAFEQDLKNFSDSLKVIFFAAGCNVIHGESAAESIMSYEIHSTLDRYVREYGWSFSNDVISQGMHTGTDLSNKPGACQYWRTHMDEALRIRELERLATSDAEAGYH